MLLISDSTFSGICCYFLTCEQDEDWPKKITYLLKSKLYFAVGDERLFQFIPANSQLSAEI